MQRYMIRPLQHGLDLSYPSLTAPFSHAHWGAKNFKVTQHSAQKRWGYNTVDRELGGTAEVQAIVLYQIKTGTRYTLYLTDTDFIKKDAGLNTDDWTSIKQAAYTVPTGERWTWCIIDDKFIFTNGNTNVQVSSAGGTATDLSSDIKKAKYCMPYANRLFVAYYGATLDPLGIAWSKEGDPTDWTDSTAGAGILVESKDFITGLGVVGASLVIYKTDSIAFGHRTGDAVTPISLPHTRERRGIGCIAPYSIIDFMGTNAFIGRNDFYAIEGDHPVAIGGKMRDKFFDIVNLDDIEEVYGWENNITNELCWTANTDEGRLIFAWDYKLKEWSVYDFAADFVMAGKGTISEST